MANNKDININIKADSNDASKNLGELKKQLEFTNEAAKDLSATFEDVYGEMKPLSGRIGEIEDRLYELALAGKQGTEEFSLLSNEAGRLKKNVIDVDMVIDGMSMTTGQKLGGALSAATSGFAVLQGAMGTFGQESEFVQEAMLKVQSAMAIQQGIQGIKEAIPAMKALGSTIMSTGVAQNILTAAQSVYTFVVGTSTGALKLFKIALAATGIGLIIIALVAAADAMGMFGDATDDTAQSEEELAAAIEKTNTQISNRKQAAKEGMEIVDNMTKQNIINAKLAGKSEEEIAELMKGGSKKRLEVLEQEMRDSKEMFNKYSKEGDIKQYEAALTSFKEASSEVTKYKLELAEADADALVQQREDEKKNYQDRVQDAKEFAKKRLDAQRLIEDLRIELIESDFDREIELNNAKYQRLIEDTKTNESLTQEERIKIIDYYNNLQVTKETEIRNAKSEEDRLALEEKLRVQYEKEDEQYKLLQELRSTDKENEIASLVEEYELKFELAIGNHELEMELMIQQKEDIAAIEEEYRLRDLEAEKAASDEKKRLAQEEFDRKIGLAEGYANSVNSLAGNIFAISNNLGAQDEKSKEARAKRQFNVQKALNLSLAVIDGVKAVQASLAQSPIAIGPIPNPAGIASLAFAAITSAVNIAKIASSQYKGGSSGGGGGGAAGGGGGAPNIPTPPPFEPSQFFGLGEGKDNGKPKTNAPVKVYVTETDITKTQNKVAVIESRAKIN